MLRGLTRATQLASRLQLQAAAAGSTGLSEHKILSLFGARVFEQPQQPFSILRSVHISVPSSAAQPQPVVEEPAPKVAHDQAQKDTGNQRDGYVAPHGGTHGAKSTQNDKGYLLFQPTYDKEYLESIHPKHKPPEQFYQKTGLWAVQLMRWGFDTMTGYPKNMNEARWLQRIVFLETVAGVPGMVGGMLRHMKSLRTMKRDNGWIHTLLEEAENERMHLLTFLQMKQPGPFFRAFVLLTQGVFFNLYTLFYTLSPKHCHAFVGYLEEEAVKTYTHAVKDLDEGNLPDWATRKPPELAVKYWGLGEDATMRDLLLAVRADEYSHSHVNHTFSVLKQDESNPFEPGAHTVP